MQRRQRAKVWPRQTRYGIKILLVGFRTSYYISNLAIYAHNFAPFGAEEEKPDRLHPCVYLVWKPLQTPNDRPYPVIKREGKYFIIDTRDRVSLDCLKPAYMEQIEFTTNTSTHYHTPPIAYPGHTQSSSSVTLDNSVRSLSALAWLPLLVQVWGEQCSRQTTLLHYHMTSSCTLNFARVYTMFPWSCETPTHSFTLTHKLPTHSFNLKSLNREECTGHPFPQWLPLPPPSPLPCPAGALLPGLQPPGHYSLSHQHCYCLLNCSMREWERERCNIFLKWIIVTQIY